MPDDKYVKGIDGLDRKLAQLANPRQQRAVIRSGLNYATTPIIKDVRAMAHKGTRPHKTYKGRLVAPGFASRNVARVTRIVGDAIRTMISYRKEAFYETFFERGNKKVKRDPALVPALERNRDKAIERFGKKVIQRIEKVARQK